MSDFFVLNLIFQFNTPKEIKLFQSYISIMNKSRWQWLNNQLKTIKCDIQFSICWNCFDFLFLFLVGSTVVWVLRKNNKPRVVQSLLHLSSQVLRKQPNQGVVVSFEEQAKSQASTKIKIIRTVADAMTGTVMYREWSWIKAPRK